MCKRGQSITSFKSRLKIGVGFFYRKGKIIGHLNKPGVQTKTS